MSASPFTSYAVRRWEERCRILGLDSSLPVLLKTFRKAKKERVSPSTHFHLLKRSLLHKEDSEYRVADGWRFVLNATGEVVTVERIRPHENFWR